MPVIYSTYRCLAFGSVLALFCACAHKNTGGARTVPVPTTGSVAASPFSATPVWQDEFNYTGMPDSSKWSFDTGGQGWGNNERQYYTNSIRNARVENGVLTISALKEEKEQNQYTSARLASKNKGDFLYGRVEARAKLPAGRGTWPAIWMLPTDWSYGGWPASGEIDIMEHVGFDPGKVHITVHTQAYNHSKNTQKGKNKTVPTAMTAFHLYRVDWTPDSIQGFIDDDLVFSFQNEKNGSATWPFDKRFHVLLNLAIGGNWGGTQGVDDAIFPASFEVDYVRVYKME